MKHKYLKVTLFVICGVCIGLLLYPVVGADSIYQQLEKYRYVFGTAVKEYVEEVDSNTLTEAAIKGMLNELDPHSTYITAKDMQSVDEEMQGSFEGIGVQFNLLNDTISVIAPIKNGPSEKLGILSGDKIVEIDGKSAIGLPLDSVPKLLRGPKGTVVKLGIYRYGEKNLLHFDVVRDKIPLYTVDSYYIYDNSDIGVIRLNRFAQTTHEELMKAARDLKSQGMKKLILDLRENPGGYLNQAFLVADEFLSGDTIVYTKTRKEENNEVYKARAGQELEDIPLIILINSGSASASEIVSGSVQDMDRGLIVGTTSFGKGLVQRQFKIPDGSAFRLTIARYYTASGRCIQRPYKDKDSYRNLVGRLELEEGLNLEHAIDKIKKEEANKKQKKTNIKDTNGIDLDSIEIFHTRAGRSVLGGGGITPDYVIKSDTVTKLTVRIRMKNLYNKFINNEFKNPQKIKEQYNSDFELFNKKFEITDAMIKKFKSLAIEEGVEWDEERAKIDAPYWKLSMKAILARAIWDTNCEARIFSKVDRQLQTAATLFPIAEKIKNKKK